MNVMELSPYLSGIQKIPGSKLSEKFNALNRIAKKIVESKSKNQDALDLEEVPEALKPLVQVEIARLLRQPDGIVDALKSDDSVVFSRAIKVKWFFSGSIEACSTVQYYQTHILPYVSLQSRIKIIKTLGDNLGEKSAIAEKFYVSLCEMYGEKQAYPLLKACSESFIWNRITEHEVRLDNRIVRFLFYKYPELIVKYLKLNEISDDPFERNLKRVNLSAFLDFIPRLVKKCPKAFVELIEMHGCSFYLKLSNTRTELFLVNCIDALLKNAKLFLQVLDLKTVTKKLNEEQFKIIFTQLYPKDLKSFKFDKLLEYLEFVPEGKKLPLILSTFKEVYKLNLLDCTEKITRKALILLPRDERIKQAKVKIENEPTDTFNFVNSSWICYLSSEESIECLKTLIKKTFDERKRLHLVKQLLYTCYVNSDNNALLEVLKYITTRHKNEQKDILVDILDMISADNCLKNLSQEHWDVIYNFLKFMHIKNQLDLWYNQSQRTLITSLIRFELENNHSIEDKISFLTDLILVQSQNRFNILEDNIVFEKQCLEEFLKVLPTKKPHDKNYPSTELIKNVIISIYTFNKHNLKAKSPFEPMSIKDFPWVLNATKKIINENDPYDCHLLSSIITILQEEEHDLFEELAANIKEELLLSDLSNLLPTLKTNPEMIMRNWKYSLKTCIGYTYTPKIHEFIKSSRWYQDLPIKFAEECLKIIEETKDAQALIVLALLLEGPAFEQVITPFIPSSATIDVDPEDAKIDYQMVCSASMAFNRVNPAVSLDCILKFCVGDYIHSIINCLVNVSRRTSVAKVVPFALTLIDRPVSIKKHGIRLFCMAADVKQLRRTLSELWRSETHQTIRTLVFSNVFGVFKSNPNKETWEMLKECLDDLKPDDEDIFDSLLEFKYLPNEYVADYVEKLFIVFRKLCNVEKDPKKIDWNYIMQLLDVPNDISALFSDEQHKKIIDSYVLDVSLPKNLLSSGHSYLINCYIVPARNELEERERLNHFRDILTEIVKDINVPQSNCPTFYPANYL
ncbi:GSCOCG00005275001-RA-CDS [Cotesia congregata]|nr:GSCOCG00005275001-RA-CDS [Cotesia congregata]